MVGLTAEMVVTMRKFELAHELQYAQSICADLLAAADRARAAMQVYLDVDGEKRDCSLTDENNIIQVKNAARLRLWKALQDLDTAITKAKSQ